MRIENSIILFLIFISGVLWSENTHFDDQLFTDLAIVEEVNQELNNDLPFFYNNSFIGGYFQMPSARFPQSGKIAFGGSSVPPYGIFGVNFGVFDRIELSANYRVFHGSLEKNFGKDGFGDDADRIGNAKFGILVPSDNFPLLPSIAFGLDDFIGTKRFSSQYFVATKVWQKAALEISLGWGKGRIKGFFGGIAWTPFYRINTPILKNISLIAEYDANNYKKHTTEHSRGRKVNSRINAGLSCVIWDVLQMSISSVRGEKIAGNVSLRYPLGTTKGLFPKIDDSSIYTTPIDNEPLGAYRPEREFAHELACVFAEQGLDLRKVFLCFDPCFHKQLWIKVINNRYRQEATVRERVQEVLAALIPCDVESVKVVVSAEGLPSHSYCFRCQDLLAYRECKVGIWELETLSPMKEVGCNPSIYEAASLFTRKEEIWTFTVRPRLLTFFGATAGKFKYSIGSLAAMQGLFPGSIFYQLQASYSIYSSMHGLTSRDQLNPSELLHVRTDWVRYFQERRVRLEKLYLQKSWNARNGFFFRLATGYFEAAYGGGASEMLFYPVKSSWAIGAELDTVWKRHYNDLGFFRTVPRFTKDGQEIFERFTGWQYFLNLYWNFRPLDLLFEVKVGQFLAKDKGVRIQATRIFPSGLRFALWVTFTNGHDRVNNRTYHDKGFAFYIPFDIFLKQSSRSFLTYAMSAWLRDVGAIAETGVSLFDTLYEERFD